MKKYEAVIGLEVHVQIRTATKMFCACANKYAEPPNTLVCPICMGYPGVLPVPNYEAIKKTIIAGLLCGCEISRYSKFDRKSYFYPDMPKNYQISQYDLPFCKNGKIKIGGKGFSGAEMEEKYIRINRIHLEEDVAKSLHMTNWTGIDFNRAGVPLMEIVSEADMRTPDEAYAYLTALKEIMQYAEISDCDMEKGQMRCDVNISVRPEGENKFGTKIEIKNLNSFRAVHRALRYETDRQIEAISNNDTLVQETRSWDDEKGITHILRTKESAHDYRYFPDPDLMPIEITDRDLEEIKNSLPELPATKRERFVSQFGITQYDAEVITQTKELANFFEESAKSAKKPKSVANWIISELLRELADAKISVKECKISPASLAELTNIIEANVISGKIGKTVFSEMFVSGKSPTQIIEEKGLKQVSDDSVILKFVKQAISENPKQVNQYKDGNKKVLQYFVGQVMKLSKGSVNPKIAVEMLRKELEKQ